jgi:hypothetical protein
MTRKERHGQAEDTAAPQPLPEGAGRTDQVTADREGAATEAVEGCSYPGGNPVFYAQKPAGNRPLMEISPRFEMG